MSALVEAAHEATVGQHGFTVVSNEQAAEGMFHLVMRSDVAALLEPGQFMNFQVPGNAAQVLRVPLSFARADAAAGLVDVCYAVVGDGTRRLSQMLPGDESTVVGPCGHGWRLPADEGRCLLVAGGIGLPPVFAAAEMLAQAGIGFDVVVGARTAGLLLDGLVDQLRGMTPGQGCDCERRVMITTDDGSRGLKCFTTDAMWALLKDRTYACVYTCGPNVMMRGVARLAAEHGIACQASLERMMGCGFGACSCCNVALVGGGYALCCTDGPVFDASEVAW